MTNRIQLRQEWLELLDTEFQQEYMSKLAFFLRSEKAKGKQIYPAGRKFFAALEATPPKAVKVVILGQDPYHGSGQAHGLSFSVQRGTRIPPSLQNIYRELEDDVGFRAPAHGDLTSWAGRGVLLLNSVLSVEHGRAGSHHGRGWEEFTDAIITAIGAALEPTVFLLWGSYAQRKGAMINSIHHCVLTAPHPSPLSAHKGFFGCRHFSKANRFLRANQRSEVDWSLPE